MYKIGTHLEKREVLLWEMVILISENTHALNAHDRSPHTIWCWIGGCTYMNVIQFGCVYTLENPLVFSATILVHSLKATRNTDDSLKLDDTRATHSTECNYLNTLVRSTAVSSKPTVVSKIIGGSEAFIILLTTIPMPPSKNGIVE